MCSVYDNNMGPEGAKHLADMLKVNQTLTSVEYDAASSNSSCQQPLTALLFASLRAA